MSALTRYLVLACVVCAAIPLAAGGQSAASLFQEGLMLERVEGKLLEAVDRYERVVRDFPSERTIAAQALLQLGDTFNKLGRSNAREPLETLVRDYAEQVSLVAEARARLGMFGSQTAAPGAVSSRVVLESPELPVDQFGSVSADGRHLSFMGENGDLSIYELATGSTHRVTKNPPNSREFAEYSTFSPDGSQLAYGWSDRRGNYELRVIDREGGEPKVLYSSQEFIWLSPYDWSPDGREIIAIIAGSGNRALVLVPARGGDPRTLKTLDWLAGVPNRAEFSPDGRFIAYDETNVVDGKRRDGGVFLIARDGTRRVTLYDGPGHDYMLGWFPDGKTVLFASERAGAMGAWAIGVENGAPRGEARRVADWPGDRVYTKGFTSHGDFYYYQQTGSPDVQLLNLDPTGRQVIAGPTRLAGQQPGGRFGVTWSPDGDRVAYNIGGPAVATFGIHDFATGIQRVVPVTGMTYARNPVWTPDGRALLVNGSNAGSSGGLFRIDVATGRAERLPFEGVNLWGPQVTSNGKTALAIRGTSGDETQIIAAYDFATGRDREVVRVAGLRDFRVSPDGRWILLRITEGVLDVMPVDGGERRTLLREPAGSWGAGLGWAADSRHVLLNRNGELAMIPIDGGAIVNLFKMPGLQTISASPDGRRIAVVSGAGAIRHEVRVLENLPRALAAAR